MRTGGSRRRWEGSAALVLLVTLIAGLTGCTTDGPEPSRAQASGSTAVVKEVRTLLRRRARAVREGNMTGFLSSVAPARPRLRDDQSTYFLNLRELPLGRFRYVVPGDMVDIEDDGAVEAVVLLRMQIAEFDAAPVETPARYSFVRDGRGRLRISSMRDREFRQEHDIELSPWDLGRITVVEGDRVLGIFDEETADAAYQIIDSIEDGIEHNNRVLDRPWQGDVVVYALSDSRVLASLDNLPGGDADRLDAVAFPVPAAGEGDRLAATRFVLHPRMIDRDSDIRDRLIRHELTHVALGRRDDQVPTWLSEGIAEYVSVQPITPLQRTISRASVEAARAGVADLPDDETFNGELSAANYGISWYACEYIAATYGAHVLWQLLDKMPAGEGATADRQDAVLTEVLGIDSDALAAAAGKKILATFG